MNRDLTGEELERYVDGELDERDRTAAEQHLQRCARCAAAALQLSQMKRAVREVMTSDVPPSSLHDRVRRQLRIAPVGRRSLPAWWIAAAAVVALIFGSIVITRRPAPPDIEELVDMHVTTLASANPVDVISTDRHTVKPWFEGRLPFTVPVPDLASTPFRLIGGRVVFWRGNPGADLLIGKSAHRISVFAFRDAAGPRELSQSRDGFSTAVWHSNGLTFIAVGQVPQTDLELLRRSF